MIEIPCFATNDNYLKCCTVSVSPENLPRWNEAVAAENWVPKAHRPHTGRKCAVSGLPFVDVNKNRHDQQFTLDLIWRKWWLALFRQCIHTLRFPKNSWQDTNLIPIHLNRFDSCSSVPRNMYSSCWSTNTPNESKTWTEPNRHLPSLRAKHPTRLLEAQGLQTIFWVQKTQGCWFPLRRKKRSKPNTCQASGWL